MVKHGFKPDLRATLCTFAVSAFWHGFFPLYYVMFFMCACFVEISKDLYRARILFEWIPYPSVVCNILTMIVLNYLGTTFCVLTFEGGRNFGAGTNYFIYILLPVMLMMMKALNIVGIAKNVERSRYKIPSEVDGP